MSSPSHEPEVIRAKSTQIVEKLRELMRQMGFDDDELISLTLQAERDAEEFLRLLDEP